MHALRRIALTALIAAGTAAAAPCLAQAQKFPNKPIRVVVAFTAGGTTDVLARMIGPAMSEVLGQPLVKNLRADLEIFNRLVREAGLKAK